METIHEQLVAQQTPEPAEPIEPPSEQRLYVLDLLRFGAAMFVMSLHLAPVAVGANIPPGPSFAHYAYQLTRYGWLGVEFFFVISGFVICMSSWGRGVSQFFISRVARLVPAYVFAVLLTSLIVTLWLRDGRHAVGPLQFLTNLTMVQHLVGVDNIDGVYWTLLVELKFYLVFSIVVAAGVTYRRVVLFCIAWTTAGLFAKSAKTDLLIAILEPDYTSYFVIGIVLYLIYRFRANLLLWGVLVVSWIFAVGQIDRAVEDLTKLGLRPSSRTAVVLWTGFFLVMLGVALRRFSWVRWRGLATIGALTYPLYLLHGEIGLTAFDKLKDLAPPWDLACAVPVGILMLAYLGHRWVERPMAKILRRRLRSSFQQLREGSTARRSTPRPRIE